MHAAFGKVLPADCARKQTSFFSSFVVWVGAEGSNAPHFKLQLFTVGDGRGYG
jgi:hypothetical protein